jgi:hypothetical protein
MALMPTSNWLEYLKVFTDVPSFIYELISPVTALGAARSQPWQVDASTKSDRSLVDGQRCCSDRHAPGRRLDHRQPFSGAKAAAGSDGRNIGAPKPPPT